MTYIGAVILNIVLFVPALLAVSFASFLARNRHKDGLEKIQAYQAYLSAWARAHKVLIACCLPLLLLADIGGWMAIGLIVIAAAWRLFSKPNMKFRSEKELKNWPIETNLNWLATLGPDHARRTAAIDALFEERVATIEAKYFASMSSFSKRDGETKRYVAFPVKRSLASMDNREREYLRIAELLNSAADGKEEVYRKWCAALVWGDGTGVFGEGNIQYLGMPDGVTGETAVPMAIKAENMTVDQTVNSMQQHLAEMGARSSLDPKYRAILEEYTERITPTGGGAWLKPAQIPATIFKSGDFPLHIGSFPDGTPLTYSGEGSIVTIAPPGAGKTQCNVFPNLLNWRGPAVVLDISGDIYEHTAAWRAKNIGPVYKFSPLDPEDSHKYNPLTFVRREPDYIWEDARLLAEMMIVPSQSTDPFWENEARTVLTAAIAYVCYSNPPEERPMHAVLDVLFGGKPWDQMILGLTMAVDVHVMTQHATGLSAMNEKTLSSVLQTARSSLSAWSGERVARAAAKSDWNPLDLRDGTNPTIYIYIRPNEVEAYLSLLRVFIGQHIRMLTGGGVPPHGAPPILFMLDELPRLRYMAPIDEALNIGRKYGLRLWMFAQSVGQLKTAYENADGMLGSCAVRIYMNPSGADGLAERVSEELGYVDSINDNSRKRLVEAAELSGPGFKDQQIVVGVGTKPAKIQKDFAYNDPELKSRMGAEEVAGSR
jgi:type IV secretion system protein VirD4